MGTVGYYWVLCGTVVYYGVLWGYYGVLCGTVGVLQGTAWYGWLLLVTVGTGEYWVVLGSTGGLIWVLGGTGWYWVALIGWVAGYYWVLWVLMDNGGTKG